MRSDSISDFDALARNLLGMREGSARSPQFMPIDLYRVDDHFVLHADLPGMDPGSIDVNVERGVLTLTAHRTPPPENDVQWLASERFAGVYRRQVSLGDEIDTERIEASYDNGVLNLIIPLHERAKPRRIQVTHGRNSEQHLVTSTTVASDVATGGGE
ncbi:Hsp20/alpha crystallin family protein [Flexivirga caeni]|uniref:Hsp20/alpha crystallin family protein n=1 Tax=Flexivirga caeni TaxID=2294115 RepID=UPI0011CE1E26|nr:Hsp20/alpha crystallin family protein [Flexivirga caeni]